LKRLATSLIGIPVALAVVFLLPAEIAFAVFFAAFFWAACEFLRLARAFAPSAPLGSLLLLIPGATLGGFAVLRAPTVAGEVGLWLLAGAALLVLSAALTPLLSATEVRDGLVAVGVIAFATPYFALPPLSLYRLRAIDPWLVFVLLAMVWLGDSAAYYVGRGIGRRKLAPQTSPNKTWEGAIASLLAGLAAAAVWSLLRLGEVRPGWLAVAAATCVAAQLGDLVESLIKRGAGVKDSASVLPGHGGFYDRLDALMLSTPVFLIGAWILGFESLIPVRSF
jgi:phosphatidate cytidylyltransferase